MINDEYIILPISGGLTLISVEDADRVKEYNWFIDRDGYATAFTYNGKVSAIRLHQLILGKQEGKLIDHKNRVKLDNRRCNLQHSTHKDQWHNRGPAVRNKDTPYLKHELACGGNIGNDKITVAYKEFREAFAATQ